VRVVTVAALARGRRRVGAAIFTTVLACAALVPNGWGWVMALSVPGRIRHPYDPATLPGGLLHAVGRFPGHLAYSSAVAAARVVTMVAGALSVAVLLWRATVTSADVRVAAPVLLRRATVARLLADLEPDRIEVSDRTTLRWTGAWARRHGVRSAMVSHESLDGLLGLVGGARVLADRLNARTATAYDTIICTTAWAAAEFRRIGATNVVQVPLGVDLAHFRPDRYDRRLRDRYADPGELLLLHCGRLSQEKRPQRSLAALAELRARGVPAVLVVAGSGPMAARLHADAERLRLPVRFLRFVSDRTVLARLLATADLVLAPGPVETFGLAALEALASGTPVVVSAQSALPEVIGDAGIAAAGDGPEYADAVQELAVRPRTDRRLAARRRAERYPWPAAAAGFLAALDVPVSRRSSGSEELFAEAAESGAG
jgi:alpha-1,6-mannosyltransferase